MPLPHGILIAALEEQLQHTLLLACVAETAYRRGSRLWAGMLVAVADRTHSAALDRIADLTEPEADLLEPAVSRVEHKLLALGDFRGDYADQR